MEHISDNSTIRPLTYEELLYLEETFVTYLATQAIPVEDWIKIKTSDLSRAKNLIDSFSQMVWNVILPNHHTFELKSTGLWLFVHIHNGIAEMVGLKDDNTPATNFRIESERLNIIHKKSIFVIKDQKPISKDGFLFRKDLILNGYNLIPDEVFIKFKQNLSHS